MAPTAPQATGPPRRRAHPHEGRRVHRRRRRSVLSMLLAGLSLLATSSAAGAPPITMSTSSASWVPVMAEALAPAGGYDWPVAGDPPTVLRSFDPPARPWLPGHRGVDLAAAAGAPVRAAGAGTVAFAGAVAGRPVASIQHSDGLRTTYEPVAPTVQAGDAVETGTVIGHLAEGGLHCATACLHWGVRTGDEAYLDPLVLLGAEMIVRLYPPGQG